MPFRSGAFRQTLNPFGGGALSLDQVYQVDTQTSGDGTPPVPQGTPPQDASPPSATPGKPVVPKVGPLPKPKAAAKPVAKPKITANATAKPKVAVKPKATTVKKVVAKPKADLSFDREPAVYHQTPLTRYTEGHGM
jgi:outer membrane biosynthesis protein TonB